MKNEVGFPIEIYIKKPNIFMKSISCSINEEKKYGEHQLFDIKDSMEFILSTLGHFNLTFMFNGFSNGFLEYFEAFTATNQSPIGSSCIISIICRLILYKKAINLRNYMDLTITSFRKGSIEYTFIPIGIYDNEIKIVANPYKIVSISELYKLEMIEGLNLKLVDDQLYYPFKTNWLSDVLLPKLQKILSNKKSNISNEEFDNPDLLRFKNGSLKTQSIEKFQQIYNDLKLKYASYFLKIWTEKTDPLKFIYEELSIAAFLILLFESNDHSSRDCLDFVDLGCGNGLLTYVLIKQGYKGQGIDIKKRKIWSLYSDVDSSSLIEATVDPETYRNPCKWIIGNHSDELTPWIPIIASRSSYFTNFFVLPCCFFDLFSKANLPSTTFNGGRYIEYLKLIDHVIESCGFEYKTDNLRIPSTKMTCFYSSSRLYSESEFISHLDRISKFIDERRTQCQTKKFIARDAIQPVKNCTKIDHDIKNRIIKTIADQLIASVSIQIKLYQTTLSNTRMDWFGGEPIKLVDLVKKMDPIDLKHLSNEHGGLKTLIKNHGFIFKFENDQVSFVNHQQSNYKFKRVSNSKSVYDCWFHLNHPQGCPMVKPEECFYKHE